MYIYIYTESNIYIYIQNQIYVYIYIQYIELYIVDDECMRLADI